MLRTLTERARAIGLSDTEWAIRAGVRKETLSRLRTRASCDFSTLTSLAEAAGVGIGVVAHSHETTADGLFPRSLDRTLEQDLLGLCASGEFDPQNWRELGPPFFMAGLAVMLASVDGFDRQGLLELAECLHAGSSQVGVFALWLADTPLRPSRFLPMLESARRRAA